MLLLNVFTQSTGALVLLVLSIIVPLVSVVLNTFFPCKIEFNMTFPESIEKGDPIEGILSVSKKSFLPTSGIDLKIKCENIFTGEISELATALPLSRTESNYTFTFSSKHCGKLVVTVDEMRLSDIFGLSNKLYGPVDMYSLFVYFGVFSPKISESLAFGIAGETDRYSDSKPGYDFSEQFGIREYSPGDQIKSIHWKLTEKLDKYIVKEPGLPMQNSTLLLFETGYEGNNKPLPKVRDAMAEAFVSISQALSDEELPHTVGWYNYKTDFFESYQMQSEEDGIGVLPKILSLGMKSDEESCVDHFIKANEGCEYSHVLCVTSYENSQISLPDQVKLSLLICDASVENQTEPLSTPELEIINFTPQTMHHDLGIVCV